MEYYPIISIDKKYCKYSEPHMLNALKTCIACEKIPLPSYKSFQNQKCTYCRDCYAEQNFDVKSFIEPTEEQKFILGNLVINCKFEEKGCRETYKVNTLKLYLDHEKICHYNFSRTSLLKVNSVYINESQGNCFRCDDKYFNVANHDCISTLLKLIKEMNQEIKILTSWYHDENTEKLESTPQFNSLIAQLSQKFNSSLEIQNQIISQESQTNTLNEKTSKHSTSKY